MQMKELTDYPSTSSGWHTQVEAMPNRITFRGSVRRNGCL